MAEKLWLGYSGLSNDRNVNKQSNLKKNHVGNFSGSCCLPFLCMMYLLGLTCACPIAQFE